MLLHSLLPQAGTAIEIGTPMERDGTEDRGSVEARKRNASVLRGEAGGEWTEMSRAKLWLTVHLPSTLAMV